MRRDHASVVAGVGTVLGCLLVVGGAWLRWVVVEPGPHFDIYVPGVETGFELHDYLLLGLTGAGVALSAVLSIRRERLAGISMTATGVAVGLLTLGLAFSLVAPGDPTFSAHVLGPGAYVTMLGALLLTVAGWYQYVVHGGEPLMTVSRRRLAVELTTLAGVVAVAVGVWLPWIVINPEYPARFPRLYISGIGYRIEAFDWWILGLVALGVGNGVDLSGRRDRVAGVARGVAGLAVVLLTLLWVGDWGGLDCLYIPVVDLTVGAFCRYAHGPGVFVTTFGGALLILTGGYQFVTARAE